MMKDFECISVFFKSEDWEMLKGNNSPLQNISKKGQFAGYRKACLLKETEIQRAERTSS